MTQRKLSSFFIKNTKKKEEEPERENDMKDEKDQIAPVAKRARTTAPKTVSKPEVSVSVELNLFGIARLENGWHSMLEQEFQKHYFRNLKIFLEKEEKKGKKIYPPRHEIFRAFDLCHWEDVKVVIIGQANGLAFSVHKGIQIPPSLRNIHKEAMSDVNIKKPTNGLLEPWASQGVLLLNTVLTVQASCANSHKNQGWESFTDAVIRLLNKEKEGLVFLLWGRPANKKAESVDTDRHYVITSSHPSPLGATKTAKPFITSKCFSRANKYLIENGKEPIDWSLN